jgi:hypothetical protein
MSMLVDERCTALPLHAAWKLFCFHTADTVEDCDNFLRHWLYYAIVRTLACRYIADGPFLHPKCVQLFMYYGV